MGLAPHAAHVVSRMVKHHRLGLPPQNGTPLELSGCKREGSSSPLSSTAAEVSPGALLSPGPNRWVRAVGVLGGGGGGEGEGKRGGGRDQA